MTLKLDRNGRILIPYQIRKKMGVSPGCEVLLAYSDGELRLYTRDQALRKLQSFARALVPAGTSVVDELIAERRAGAKRDLAD